MRMRDHTLISAWQEAWPGDNVSGQSKKQWLKKNKQKAMISVLLWGRL